ncbi:diacylglycerol/lipid kinase family protein [Glutamicibacter arilaitensis]|uniref:diacylglycerol/lipid kinase family protein n=1 Tax=Glutamicibacter arilaitensis TaxID=256701 RepID=UPI00384EEFBD
MRRVEELEALLRARGLKPKRLNTASQQEREISEALTTADAVIVIGGDGLIHHTIQHLAGKNIPLGIIPAGSGNDTWRMYGARSVDETMQRVVRFLAGVESATQIDLLQLRFANDPTRTTFVIGAVSWGFEGLVNGRANGLPRRLGSLRYILGLLLSVPKLHAYPAEVQAQGLEFNGTVFAASISNIKSLGGGMRLFPHADYTDGLADISLVKGPGLLPVLPFVGHILSGKPHRHQISKRTAHVVVRTSQESYADGELIGQGNFEMTVLSGELSLIPGADNRKRA